MNDARFERLQDLVAQALEREPAQRAAFLRAVGGDDPEVRAEAESLLGYEREGDALLENSALALLGDSDEPPGPGAGELRPGDQLGDGRIIGLLGEGGMSEVYLAEDTRLGRRVALKLLKPRLGDDAAGRRFRHERKVLAALNHPNIARLYGGTVTPEGRSYLVMEYVEGERLDRYCETHRLKVAERLRLFRKICAAVAYAHQNLVVHRDLKPANIRVTPEGEPKLLDFGIAKLLDPEGSPRADLTVTMFAAMTPEYASPEQARGEAITTASDVYSLGVVLYEMLCGQRPYQLKGRRSDELVRAICEEEAPRPSTVARDSGGEPPARVHRLLKGDLDNIVARALRKEPARRYPSVAELAEDLRRHGEGLPVSARRDTLGYRAGKFARRNRVLVVAVALVGLALVGGLFATAREARRANRRFGDVRRLANMILFELEPQISHLSGSTAARSTLVRRSLEYLDSLSQEAGNDRELRRELATAYQKVGNVQGNPTVSNLGDIKGALKSIRKARDLRLELAAGDPRDARARHELALSYEDLGDIAWWSDDTDGALTNYRAALALRRALMAEQPLSVEFRRGFGSVLTCLADVYSWNNQHAEALAALGEALPALQAVADGQPNDPEARINVVRCWVRLGIAHRDAGEFAAGEAEFERAAATMAAVVEREPDNQSARLEEWYVAFCQCELFRDQPDLARGLAAGPRMVSLAEELVRKDPKNTLCEHNLASSYNVYGEILLRAGQSEEAVGAFQKALGIDQALAEGSPENGEYPHSIGALRMNLGAAYLALGRLAQAEAEEAQAHALLTVSANKDPGNSMPRRELVRVLVHQAKIRESQQQPAEAQRLFQEALTSLEALTAKNVSNQEDARLLGELRDKRAAASREAAAKQGIETGLRAW